MRRAFRASPHYLARSVTGEEASSQRDEVGEGAGLCAWSVCVHLLSISFRNNIEESAEWGVRRTDTTLSSEIDTALQRDALFISRANPEDNQFTLWPGLKLNNEVESEPHEELERRHSGF